MAQANIRRIVYLDGRFLPASEALISPDDRGFLLGDGVFDTMRTYFGKVFAFEKHAERIFEGLGEIRIAPPFDKAGLRAIVERLHRENGFVDSVVRVTVTRGTGAGGYAFDPSTPPTVYAACRPAPDVAMLRRTGVDLSYSNVPRPLPFLSVVKTTSVGAMALARILSTTYETVMEDHNGDIAECSASTLYMVKEGSIFMPHRRNLLPSVTCAVISSIAAVEERRLRRADLLDADALFVSATSTGPIPVRRLEGRNYPVDDPALRLLMTEYDRVVVADCGGAR